MSIKLTKIPIPRLTDSDLKRFWSKVNKDGDCWLWTASVNGCGYGRFNLEGLIYLANRIAYSIEHGDPGDFLFAMTVIPLDVVILSIFGLEHLGIIYKMLQRRDECQEENPTVIPN